MAALSVTNGELAKMKTAHLLLLGTSAFVVAMPSLARAQSADPAPQSAPADSKKADKAKSDDDSGDIIVTGERANRFGTDTVQSGSFRNAKVLDVPMTVAVIPSAVLKSQQAVDLIDAVRNTAGVSSSGVGPASYNNITIRGIAVDTRSSYKMDGTLNILSSTSFPLEDKDRVEVLKGASALYYGFSPPSGIVNLVMKRPTQDVTFMLRAFGDANGGYGGHLDVGNTVRIFGYRLNLVAAHMDTGVQYATGSRYVASGTFDLKPTDKLTLSADVEYFRKQIVEPATFIIPNGATAIPNVKLLDPSTNIGGLPWDTNDTEEVNYLGKAVYQFNKDWDISGYYGRSHLTRYRFNPGFQPGIPTNPNGTPKLGGTPTTAQYLAAIDPSNPAYGAGQIRFGSTIQSAGYENIGYSIELHGKITTGDISNSILVGASRSLRALAGSAATPRTFAFQNFINPHVIANPNEPRGGRPPVSVVDDKGAYVFDQLSYKDIVILTGGVRASDYSNDGSTNTVTKTPYRVKPTAWSGGAMVKPVKWASIYGTYIQGLEENSIASNNVDNANTVFAPIASTLYEGGIKLQPRKDLLIQASYFDITRVGAYSERLIPGTTILHGFADATQTYRGFEGSLTGYVTKDLAINAAITFLKARTFQALNPASIPTRPGGTPNSTWSLSGEYTLSWLDPHLKVSAGAYHTGTQAVDDTDKVFTPSYTTFDVGASYDFELAGHDVTARVNGQNITNERYWAAVGAGTLAESLPSVIKFSLEFKY
jgi:iron complex outermembrane receptor protein